MRRITQVLVALTLVCLVATILNPTIMSVGFGLLFLILSFASSALEVSGNDNSQ